MTCTKLIVNAASRPLEKQKNRMNQTSKHKSTLNVILPNFTCKRAIAMEHRPTFGVLTRLCLLFSCLWGPCFPTLGCDCLAPSFTTSAHDLATVKGKC